MKQLLPKHKILYVAAEVAPFATVGGLSQVSYFLPKEILKSGCDIRIFTPKHGSIPEEKFGIKPLISHLKVPTFESEGVKEIDCTIKIRRGNKSEPTVYFLENQEYFGQRANVYGYGDDHIRFALLSLGAVQFLKQSDWVPDVIHANDWHTGYLINYLRTEFAQDNKLKSISTVLTIHNLASQGVSDYKFATPLEFDDGKGKLQPLFSSQFKRQNSLKRGIIYGDLINTVSERYSREIMTPEYGEGLDQLLKEVRGKMYGVLNGLDYKDFNPATDSLIKKNYSISTIKDKTINKRELQKEFNLPINERIPLLAIQGRLTSQKGLDLVLEIVPYLLKEYDVQIVVMGRGESRYRDFFTKLEKNFPKQVGTHLMANWQLPRKIYAGCDLFLLPSKFEPGGIVVIEALRYGAIPIVRATGGLADIVEDFDLGTETGTGFTFSEFSPLSFFGALVRALEIYKAQPIWQKMIKRAMQADFSWEASAQEYLDLYKRAVDFRLEAISDNPAPAFR